MKSMHPVCVYRNVSQHVHHDFVKGLPLQQSRPHDAPRVNDGIARSEGRWCTTGLHVNWYLHMEHVTETSILCKERWVGHECKGSSIRQHTQPHSTLHPRRRPGVSCAQHTCGTTLLHCRRCENRRVHVRNFHGGRSENGCTICGNKKLFTPHSTT